MKLKFRLHGLNPEFFSKRMLPFGPDMHEYPLPWIPNFKPQDTGYKVYPKDQLVFMDSLAKSLNGQATWLDYKLKKVN